MLRVGDNHCHLNPTGGMGVRAFAKRFIDSGGWFVGLVNLLSWSYGVSVTRAEDYEKVYRATITVARELEREGIKVAVILGPHPAELTRLITSGVKPDKAAKMILDAYKLAAKHVENGEAEGLGEVGRPHWQAPEEVIEACNTVLNEVVDMARQLDCLVHFHVERGGKATIDDLASRIKAGGGKFVLHHAEGSYSSYAYERGLLPSVPAREDELKAALACSTCFVVESDFLDDPKRPGAVVAPWSISRTFSRLIERGVLNEEQAWRILVTNIEELYGVQLG